MSVLIYEVGIVLLWLRHALILRQGHIDGGEPRIQTQSSHQTDTARTRRGIDNLHVGGMAVGCEHALWRIALLPIRKVHGDHMYSRRHGSLHAHIHRRS